jgi:uncharacterized membrane protein YbhN (UPF0104 family)
VVDPASADLTDSDEPEVELAPPRRRRQRDRGTLAWTMAKCLLLSSLIALALAIWLAITPVQNPGVQDCGSPLAFVVVNRTDVKVSTLGPNAPPDAATLLVQPRCRERVDSQLVRATVAFGAFIGLGLLGAIIGLIDDRWQYHQAPRFETLLRERPANAPGRLRPPPVVAPEEVGRSLPPVEGPDVWILIGLSAVVIAGLAAFAGPGDVSDAIGSVGTVGLIGLGLGAVVTFVVAAIQLWLSQPEPDHETLSPAAVGEVELAGAAAFRLLPGLGPLGFDAHALVSAGAGRVPSIRRLQARQFSGLAAHLVLLVLALVVADIGGRPPVELPAAWWVLALGGAILVLIGAARGVGRWKRLVVKPRWSALRELAAGGQPERAGGLAASSLGLTVVNAGIFGAAMTLASTIDGGLPATATIIRLALIYLASWAIGTLSPTPGGVGAFEPAAVLGLLLAGLDPVPAVAGVLLFRVATFWLPVVIGLIPLRRLRRRGLA